MTIYGATIVTLLFSEENPETLINVESTTKLFKSRAKMDLYTDEIDIEGEYEVFTFEDSIT